MRGSLVGFLVLSGCFVTKFELNEALDRDEDGFLPVEAGGDDCDEERPDIHPGADEICGDGLDNNCDGVTDDDGLGARIWFADADGDGFGSGETRSSCTEPAGFAPSDGDCDDADPSVNPGVLDLCDGLDQDCDGTPDDEVPLVERYRDADGDGIGTTDEVIVACTDVPGFVNISGDCDDTDDTISPVAVDLCDGIDQDCDGVVDDDAVFTEVFFDGDGDGIGTDTNTLTDCGAVPDYVFASGDCDDTDPTISPAALDLCDGIDQNCNGLIDDDSVSAVYFLDVDGDGAGNSNVAVESCGLVPGYVQVEGDCDDEDPGISPLLSDGCDGIDQDCDGLVDEDAVRTLYFEDLDQDGIGSSVAVEACAAPPGYSQLTGDCDDTDATRTPEAIDLCNGIDEDCDGTIDNDAEFTTWFRDVDGDGLGRSGNPASTCDGVPDGYVASAGDCDDTDALVTVPSWYVDGDGDGFGSGGRITVCVPPAGHSDVDTDCDDGEPTRFPGNPEVCNTGIDEDCEDATDCRGLGPTNALGSPPSLRDAIHIRVHPDFIDGPEPDFLVDFGGRTKVFSGPMGLEDRAAAEIPSSCPSSSDVDLNGDGRLDLLCADSVYLAGGVDLLDPEMVVVDGQLVGGLTTGPMGPGVFSQHDGVWHFIPYQSGTVTIADSITTFSALPIVLPGCRPGVTSCVVLDDPGGLGILEDISVGDYTIDDAEMIVSIAPEDQGGLVARLEALPDVDDDGEPDLMLRFLADRNPDIYFSAVVPGPLTAETDVLHLLLNERLAVSTLDAVPNFAGDYDADGRVDWWSSGSIAGVLGTELRYGVEGELPVIADAFAYNAESPVVVDWNSDGRMDLVFLDADDGILIRFGRGI